MKTTKNFNVWERKAGGWLDGQKTRKSQGTLCVILTPVQGRDSHSSSHNRASKLFRCKTLPPWNSAGSRNAYHRSYFTHEVLSRFNVHPPTTNSGLLKPPHSDPTHRLGIYDVIGCIGHISIDHPHESTSKPQWVCGPSQPRPAATPSGPATPSPTVKSAASAGPLATPTSPAWMPTT